MNIQTEKLKISSQKQDGFVEGCKQMSVEATYAFRKMLKEKLGFSNEIYINNCTKEFVNILLT